MFGATWQTFVKKCNNWKSILFHENTGSVIVQQNIQNTHTQDEMQIYNFIRPMKAHTRWNALNKELFCGVNKSNPLSKIKIDLNCEEMRFIKTNLHRILEFAFRNIILENYCLAIPQILELANYQRAFWAERALRSVLSERSTIFRKTLSALKEIWPLHSTHMLC